jgi:transposase-like protein
MWAFAIAVAFLFLVLWLTRPSCPRCGSFKVMKDAVRTWSGGIYIGVSDYRCESCGKVWRADT